MATLIGLLRLLKLPFIYLSTPPPDTFKNQTILITGANVVVGFEAAKYFACLGASRIVLGVRSLEKGQKAGEVINSTSPDARINVWEVNLDSFASVKAFAAKCEKELPRLDVAIMNAGMRSSNHELTVDGWEKTLQAHPESLHHLTIVSSDAHLQAIFSERNEPNILESLNTKVSLSTNPFDRYAVSKLFDAYIAIELANLVPELDGRPAVIVNYVTPRFCQSELLSKAGEPPLVLRILEKLLARKAEYGALCYVDAACKGVVSYGKYLNHQVEYPPGILATSDEGVKLREKVWGEILGALEKSTPEVRSRIVFSETGRSFK